MPEQSKQTGGQEYEDVRTSGQTNNNDDEIQACPECGMLMQSLKGGTKSICKNCGFRESDVF